MNVRGCASEERETRLHDVHMTCRHQPWLEGACTARIFVPDKERENAEVEVS